jgi:uncharacterized protein (DUF2336 family)
MSLAVSRVLCDGRLIAEVVSEHASLVAAAPDLAATVEALHAEVERLRATIATLEALNGWGTPWPPSAGPET